MSHTAAMLNADHASITSAKAPRRMLRSAGAMVAGFAAIVVLSTVTDLVLQNTIYPTHGSASGPAALLGLALVYRTAYGVLGSWIAAKLAPGRPMTHAVALGAIGCVLATLGVVAQWSLGDHWYPMGLATLTLPAAWVGGRLAKLKPAPRAA